MSEKLPITAIIPTYNRSKLCYEALESIYSQTCIPAQIIVVDDDSSENMDEIKKLFKQRNGNYIYQINSGVASARNLGVYNADQDWITFLDSDDIWLQQKLEKQFLLHCNYSNLMISQTAKNLHVSLFQEHII